MPNDNLKSLVYGIGKANLDYAKLIKDINQIRKVIPKGEKLSSENPEVYRGIIERVYRLIEVVNIYIENKNDLIEYVKSKLKNSEKLKYLKLIAGLKQLNVNLRGLENTL